MNLLMGFPLRGTFLCPVKPLLGQSLMPHVKATMELLSDCILAALTQATLKGLFPSPSQTEFRFFPTFLQGLLGRVTGLADNLVHKNGSDENKHAHDYFMVKTAHQK